MDTLLKEKKTAPGLEINFENAADADLVRMLEESVYGTPGGVLYRHHGTGDKIRSHKNLSFITIRRNKRIVATVGFCRRNVSLSGTSHLAYYIRYLCMNSFYRSAAAKKKRNNPASLNNLLVTKVQSLIDKTGSDQSGKKLSYAFIEEANKRSLELSGRFGYEVIRKYNTILFSRFFPRKSMCVSRIREEEKEDVKRKIKKQYSNYSFYFEDHLFYQNNYYVLKKDGKIVAGVQANPVEWEFQAIPGISGFLMLRILPKIPVLSRLFKRKNRFLAFESAFVLDGYENEIPNLFESVCAMNHLNMGILWLDEQSIHYQKFNSIRGFGLLKKLKKSASVNILVRFDGYSEEEKKKFYYRPVFISAFDMT